jgi:thiol-disulfide isomerase/thioredoxin
MKTILRLLVLAAVAALFASSVRAALSVGRPAPDFTLTDIHGKALKLSDFRGKTVVVEWVNPECPFVRKHYESGNMPKLQKAAAADGVVWLSINSGAQGMQGDFNPGQVAAWMKSTGAAPAHYFRDQDGRVGKLFAALNTPHLFVINPAGVLVYNGAIDSIRSADIDDIPKATNYVAAALAAVKAGKPVAVATSQPYGCHMQY